MPKKRFNAEQIVTVLRQIEVLMPQCDILRPKLAFRFEWRSQDDQEQP